MAINDNVKPAGRRGIRAFSYLTLWQEAWTYADRRMRRTIITYHCMYACGVAILLSQPYLFGRLISILQQNGPDLFRQCATLLGLIILSELGFWSMHGPGRVLESRTARLTETSYIEACYLKLSELPLSWHQDHHSGSTINRIRTAGGGLGGFVSSSFISFQQTGMLIGAMAMLTWINPYIGLISFTGFIISMFAILRLNRRMIQSAHEVNEVNHLYNATFFDLVSNIVSIIMLRLQKLSQGTLNSRLEAALPPLMRQSRLNEWRYFSFTMINSANMAAILLGFIFVTLKSGQAIEAGLLVTIYLYQRRIGEQGFDFISMHSNWLFSLTNIKAAADIHTAHAELAHAAPAQLAARPQWRDLQITNLNFTYLPSGGRPGGGLHDVSLHIRRGERIALIGGSGAGKSTLLTVLRGLYPTQGGRLFIDGIAAPFSAMADMATLIPQEPEIFENSLRFNISFGMDVPDVNLRRALDLAMFTPVLAGMPAGLETDVREKGVNMSGGQKQRLALARGLFAAEESDIILLDEPTSSLDLITEEHVFQNIFDHFKTKVVIATLHRLYLLPRFDRVVYLEHGRVVVDLPSAEALIRPGPIRSMYLAAQSSDKEPIP